MTVKREDLMAAASMGVLNYKQVDPVLIFLLQRDILTQREGMLKEQAGTRGIGVKKVLLFMLAILMIVVAAAAATFYTKLAFDALGVGGLLWFIGLYALFTMLVAAWFERMRISAAARIFVTAVIGLLPLAVFASQHFKVF